MREVRFALRQTVPIFFTYIFLGIAFGVMMTEAGYSAGWSVLCAVFIYAGSLQIVMVSLLQAGASLPAVAVMTFFVNARHIFYGVGFIERFRKMGWRYPYLVLALTDETYSILCSVRFEDGVDENRATFFIALFNQSYWVLGCLLGGLAGQVLPWDLTGIDFSATAFFLVVVVNQWRASRSRIPAAVGLASALVFFLLLGPEGFLIPALAASMLALAVLRDTVQRREEGRHAA